MKENITHSSEETRRFAQNMATNFHGGEILCLKGDLGSGKTTFAQGILEYFGAPQPYTSPTFLILKEYPLSLSSEHPIRIIYHIDAYRIGPKDLLNLGWEDMLRRKDAVILIEWPENIREIIPDPAKWISFRWINDSTRKIY